MRAQTAAHLPASTVLLLTMLLVGACVPIHEGPQLRTVPEGLSYTNSIDSAGLALPARDKVRQVAYIPLGEQRWPLSVIIAEYRGTTSSSEVEAARLEVARHSGSTAEVGELETLRIDGHAAWGWLQTHRRSGDVTGLTFTAIVAYPAANYTIVVSSLSPKLKPPEYLRDVARTFAVRHEGDADAWALIVAGALLGVFLTFLWRLQGRTPGSATDTVSRLLRR